MNINKFLTNGGFKLAIILFITSVYCARPVSAFNDEALVEFGDAMQFVLPGIGLGLTAYYGDKEGAKQWAWSGLTSVGTTTVLKGFYSKIRPNGSDSALSFPSGHTTAVFWGASFLDQRYGKWWGIPAYAAATVTAYSRVVSDNHHVDDTLMGASIALMSSWYWVTPHEGSVSLIPYQQNDAVGVMLHFDGSAKPNDYSGLSDDERWRYSIVFGPGYQLENKVTAPTASGTTFDLRNFDGTNNPTTTANAVVEWFSGKHRSLFSVLPYEVRDNGRFATDTSFAGVTYTAGDEIRSSYRMTDVRLQYYYDLMKSSPLILEIGGGISYQHTNIELEVVNGTQTSQVSSNVWRPLFNAAIGYEFNPKISLVADLSGVSLSNQAQLDANISVGYRLNKYWDAGIGYGIYDSDSDTSELSSSVRYNVLMTYVGYSFY